MRIGCHEACACLSSCYEVAEQAFTASILTCHEIIQDMEALQKACILGGSIIQGFNLCFQITYLAEFAKAIDIAQSFDFYGFCRIPSYLFSPYQPDRIDDYALLENLEAVLRNNWDIEENDNTLHAFAKEQLVFFLTRMDEEEMAYRSEEEVRTSLRNTLFLALKKEKDHAPDGFDPDFIDLSSLSIPLKKTSVLTVLIDFTFLFVDIGCIPVFFQEWSLIDLSGFTNRLAQFRFLSWLPQQSLDDNVRRLMCTGFSLQFIKSLYTLCQAEVEPDERRAAKWMMAASAAECIYNYTILKRKNDGWIILFAIIAKSTGLILFLMTPKPTFFTDS
jgi:hypothetical protein